MLWLIFLLVSFLASMAGSICGIGGGVIIKPALDAAGVLSVSAISFLSGCTVLSMSVISVGKALRRRDGTMDLRIGSALAAGAALGGAIGKALFQYAYVICPNENQVGAIQAAVLLAVTLGTLVYTLYKVRIHTLHVTGVVPAAGIGLILGIMSSFLGIGGGPINLVVLHYFFSMETKPAAACSLYVILFSQLTSLLSTLVRGAVPEVDLLLLLLMVGGGVTGGLFGSRLNRRISDEGVNRLFVGLMAVIIGICVWNILRFTM